MKKIISIVVVLCCWTSVAWALADEWEGLSLQEKEMVQLQTREMSAVGVPATPAQNMLLQMVRSRFSEQNMIRAQQVVMVAAKTGLPTEPVMNKAMEGMAKQAREQQIIAAMETVRDRYAYAEQMAISLATEKKSVGAIRQAIADSLAAGMQTADLEALKSQLQTRTRQQSRNTAEDNALAVQTMLTARAMARQGVESPEVAEVLAQALQNAYNHREMEQLRHQVATASQQQSPQEAANRHANSIGKDDDAGGEGTSGSGGGGSVSGNSGSGSGSGAGDSGSDTSGNDGSGAGNSGGGNSGSGNAGGDSGPGSNDGSGAGNTGGGSGSGRNDGSGADNAGGGPGGDNGQGSSDGSGADNSGNDGSGSGK